MSCSSILVLKENWWVHFTGRKYLAICFMNKYNKQTKRLFCFMNQPDWKLECSILDYFERYIHEHTQRERERESCTSKSCHWDSLQPYAGKLLCLCVIWIFIHLVNISRYYGNFNIMRWLYYSAVYPSKSSMSSSLRSSLSCNIQYLCGINCGPRERGYLPGWLRNVYGSKGRLNKMVGLWLSKATY